MNVKKFTLFNGILKLNLIFLNLKLAQFPVNTIDFLHTQY